MSWLAEKIEAMVDGFIDTFIELGQDALDAMGLTAKWDALSTAMMAPINILKGYAPLAHALIDFGVLNTCFSVCFSLIASLVLFKIVVKLIPTIY